MRHGIAFGIKLIIVSIVTLSLFGIFYNASLTPLIVMSFIIAGTGYIIGDLLILRRLGNVFASLLDFVLYFATIWLLSGMFLGASNAMTIASLAASYLITVTEPLFHAYMEERVFEEDRPAPAIRSTQYQTEFAEEHNQVRKTENISENKQTDMNQHQ